jgi:hypothetical protein
MIREAAKFLRFICGMTSVGVSWNYAQLLYPTQVHLPFFALPVVHISLILELLVEMVFHSVNLFV